MGIFDQIKNAFSSGEKEPASRESRPEPAPAPQPKEEPAADAPQTYTVQSGDTLWKIAEDKLGDGNRYTDIFEANRDQLDNPDHILPGQDLKLP